MLPSTKMSGDCRRATRPRVEATLRTPGRNGSRLRNYHYRNTQHFDPPLALAGPRDRDPVGRRVRLHDESRPVEVDVAAARLVRQRRLLAGDVARVGPRAVVLALPELDRRRALHDVVAVVHGGDGDDVP